MPDPRTREAIALMAGFAERSGLDSDRPLQRYLWTDAFAVCNYLGLARVTGEPGEPGEPGCRAYGLCVGRTFAKGFGCALDGSITHRLRGPPAVICMGGRQ